MFVTRMSLRGLTQICGAFSIHTAFLISILLYLPQGDYQAMEESNGATKPDDEKLYRLLIATHTMLMLSTLLVSLNLFEGII